MSATPAVQARVRYLAPPARLAGYRKLLAFAVVAVCGTVLQALGSFDATVATFLGTAFLTYVGGNVREHAHRSAASDGQAAPAVVTSPPGPARPGDLAPFAGVEPSDRTDFDPERPAVDRETLVNLLATLAAETLHKTPARRGP